MWCVMMMKKSEIGTPHANQVTILTNTSAHQGKKKAFRILVSRIWSQGLRVSDGVPGDSTW